MDIQVFESDRFFFSFFSRFLSFFFLEDGDGRKKINPKIHKKAIVIGNQMINYWMFQHFPAFSHGFSHGFSVSGSPAGSRQITWRATAFAVALVRNRSNGQSVIFIGINGI